MVLNKFKDNMFFIGIFIFSVTCLLEQLFFGENHLTCFFKGFGCGLELVGIIIIFMRKKKVIHLEKCDTEAKICWNFVIYNKNFTMILLNLYQKVSM